MGRAFEFRKARKMKRWASMAKTFTRIGKDIVIAVKEGGPSPETNAKLRVVIQNAKTANMPKDNIQRAIKKGEGNDPDSNFEEVRYEGYGPSGVAVIVEAMTNNKNRTAAEIRSTFSKFGGNLGETGSVSYNFKRLGSITIEKKFCDENELLEFVIENGSEDFETNEVDFIIYCDPNILHNLNEKIQKKFGETSIELIWKSDSSIDIKQENSEKLFKLLNTLEENDDVQSVSSNFNVSEKILETLT